jgi:hypothetical protein
MICSNSAMLAAINFMLTLKAELSFMSHFSSRRPLEMGLVNSKFTKTCEHL